MSIFLLTAFEPFGGAIVNGSLEAARLLVAERDDTHLCVLPVVRETAPQVLLREIEALQEAGTLPRVVVSLGEAGPEPVIRIEKAYLNWDDFRIPDNAGNTPRDTTIVENGPAAYFATVPVASLVAALNGEQETGFLPVRVSLTAGSFVCNHTAYVVSHTLSLWSHLQSPPSFVFVHVPAWRPEDGPSALHTVVQTIDRLLDRLTYL